MPFSQVEKQMRHELGDDWRSKFAEFDEKPFAAASIGQVKINKSSFLSPILRFIEQYLWMVTNLQLKFNTQVLRPELTPILTI